jgi:DNA-binding response OmpR family regulator
MSGQPEGNVIVVVDPCQSDYELLIQAGKSRGIRFAFLKTDEEALRLHAPAGVLAWMINMQLPCLTGLELYELLRPRLAGVPVLMVDNQYDAARELSVLTMGRLHYLCKPLEAAWIDRIGSLTTRLITEPINMHDRPPTWYQRLARRISNFGRRKS